MKQTNYEDKKVDNVYSFIRQYAEMKLDDEEKREQSLLTQSSNMQSAFSIMVAAIFMLMPVVIEHRGKLSLESLFVGCAVVVALLLLSLLFACFAQNRKKGELFEDVDIISNYVISNKNSYSTTVLQDKAISEIIKEVQKSKSVNNDKRVNQIRLSMGCFYAALVAILCWFLYSIYVIAS